ncbi:hypothetical protein SJAG_04010 [Schizosaccharomyces japonicus yFS275]|uniref:SEC7 domain-containing protein n=1 Tax=Schizosaccharomyces japonicus (strain yFS275 / FY16936) TaxID=402676 RepID=B6K5N4_SCHJY|nr:hypothetical protein SJAG_04010 [Schizosaccharomyces japonicus yFS275]EEB08838.1 hypothetical protein SJAG_04010 [Schizosaccharomyces japonicus yFS275]
MSAIDTPMEVDEQLIHPHIIPKNNTRITTNAIRSLSREAPAHGKIQRPTSKFVEKKRLKEVITEHALTNNASGKPVSKLSGIKNWLRSIPCEAVSPSKYVRKPEAHQQMRARETADFMSGIIVEQNKECQRMPTTAPIASLNRVATAKRNSVFELAPSSNKKRQTNTDRAVQEHEDAWSRHFAEKRKQARMHQKPTLSASRWDDLSKEERNVLMQKRWKAYMDRKEAKKAATTDVEKKTEPEQPAPALPVTEPARDEKSQFQKAASNFMAKSAKIFTNIKNKTASYLHREIPAIAGPSTWVPPDLPKEEPEKKVFPEPNFELKPRSAQTTTDKCLLKLTKVERNNFLADLPPKYNIEDVLEQEDPDRTTDYSPWDVSNDAVSVNTKLASGFSNEYSGALTDPSKNKLVGHFQETVDTEDGGEVTVTQVSPEDYDDFAATVSEDLKKTDGTFEKTVAREQREENGDVSLESNLDSKADIFDILVGPENKKRKNESEIAEEERELKSIRYENPITGIKYEGNRPRIIVPRCLVELITLPDKSLHEFFEIVNNRSYDDEKTLAHCIWTLQEHNLIQKNLTEWLSHDTDKMKRLREHYVKKFNFQGMSILESLKLICRKLHLTSVYSFEEPMLYLLADRWHQCNMDLSFMNCSTVKSIMDVCIKLNRNYHIDGNIYRKRTTKAEFMRMALFEAASYLHKSSEDVTIPKQWKNDRWKSLSSFNIAHRERLNYAHGLAKQFNVPEHALILIDCHLRDFFDDISRTGLPTPPKVKTASDRKVLTDTTNCSSTKPETESQFTKNDCRDVRIYEKISREDTQADLKSDISHSSVEFGKEALTEEPTSDIPIVYKEADSDVKNFKAYSYEQTVAASKEDKRVPWRKFGLVYCKYFSSKEAMKGLRAKASKWLLLSVEEKALSIYKLPKIYYLAGKPSLQTWLSHSSIAHRVELQNSIADVSNIKDGYMAERSPVSLTLPDGEILVFTTESPLDQQQWCHVLNFNAAMATCPPLPECVTNVNYGWGIPLTNTAHIDNKQPVKEWRPIELRGVCDAPETFEAKCKAMTTSIPKVIDALANFQKLLPKIKRTYSSEPKNLQVALGNWNRKLRYMFERCSRLKTYEKVLSLELTYRKRHTDPITQMVH